MYGNDIRVDRLPEANATGPAYEERGVMTKQGMVALDLAPCFLTESECRCICIYMCVYENKCMKINEKKNKVFINICVYLYSNEETPLMLRVSFSTTREHDKATRTIYLSPLLGFR